MLKVRPDYTVDTAAITASELLRSGKISNEIEQVANELGLTVKFRLGKLDEALNTSGVTSEQVRYDKDGNVIETVRWKRQRTPAETARLVDVVNKSTGLYEFNRATGQALSSQFKELARRYKPKLTKRGRPQVEDVEKSPESVYESILLAPCGMPLDMASDA